MKPLDASLHDWMDARVEAYVDDELPPDERETFERVLADHDHWALQVRCARRIHNELYDLPQPTCPPQVTQAVLEHARRDQRPPSLAEWWSGLMERWFAVPWRTAWQPALAMALLVALVISSVWLSQPPETTPPATAQYSPTEIKQAEDQAKWALAYIAHVGQETQTALRQEVIQNRIASPMRRALTPLTDEPTQDTPNR